MATFHERVQDYIGEFDDVDALGIWLTEAVRRTLDFIPPQKAERYTIPADITGAGLDVTDKRVVDIRVAGRSARKVPVSVAADLATNSFSLYEATARDPAYYISNQLIFTVPTTAAVCHYLPYPELLSTTETTSLPPEMTEVIVLDVACRVKQRQIDDVVTASQDDLLWNAPDLPVAPTIPTIVPPNDIIPAAWASSGIVGVSPAPFEADLTTELATLKGYVESSLDFELAQAKALEIQSRIQEYVAKVNVYVEEQKQETMIAADARKTDAELAFRAQVEGISSLIQVYASQIQGFGAAISAEASRFTTVANAKNQQVSMMRGEYLVLNKRYEDALYFLTGIRLTQAQGEKQ